MNTFLSSVISDLLGRDIYSDNSLARARYKQELYANFPIAVSMSSWLCFALTERRVPFNDTESKRKLILWTKYLKLLQG